MIDSAQLIKIIHQLPASLISIIVTNVLLILCFALGKLVLYRNENAIKFYAYFSVVISLLFALYFISILWFSLSNLYLGNAVYAAIFPIFLFLPFIIGHFASYEKVHFYTNIQNLTLIISLLLALSII